MKNSNKPERKPTMIKEILDKNETSQPNDHEIAILKEHFPAYFKNDGTFDFERFEKYVSGKVTITHEGYELKFLGKNYARLLASLDTTTVIVPDEEHNSKPENAKSENVYISGDNLDGLNHLLKSYSRNVKCIYIDPPYNTGKDDFAYNDSYNFTVDELSEKLSIDETQAQRILDLTKRGSASHSAWLMSIYPRLLLARDLLKLDGVIFISVDDNEISNLRLIADEIFGEENHIGTIIWNNATDNNPTNIAVEHEYIVSYARSISNLEPIWKSQESAIKDLLIKIGNELSETYPNEEEFQNAWKTWYREHKSQLSPLDRYKYIDRGGVYTGSQSVHNPGKEGYRYNIIHPVTKKPCVQPLMGYRFPESTMRDLIESGKVLFGETEEKIIELKVYASEYEAKMSSIFTLDGRLGAYDIKTLFPESKQLFKNAKPVQLIYFILSYVMNPSDIFVDFYAGSSTSAEAIMKLCDSKHMKNNFILIQLPEQCKLESEGYKLGYRTIDQIGIERIKRAAEALKKANPDTTADLGFKHYTLAEPSQDTIDKMEKFDPDAIQLGAMNTILSDFGKPTVLATWLARDGYGLTAASEEVDFAGYKGYYIGKHLYLIDEKLSDAAIEAIVVKFETVDGFNPENIVLFGYSLTWTEQEALQTNIKRLKDTEKNLRVNFDVRY